MRLSKGSRMLLRVAVAVGLAFIYIPLIVIFIYAFNSSKILEWPPPSFTTHWFSQAFKNEAAREAFFTSIKAGIAATAIALGLGTLASLAVARHRFFGRETISFLVILPIALPGIVTGVAISNTFTQVLDVPLSLFTVIVGHATFCIGIGTAAGLPAARSVKMTAIPQMVAAFNGVGGAAAALVSLAEFDRAGADSGVGTAAAVVFSALVGAISFSGSAVTYAKLQELMTGRPIVLPTQRLLNAGLGLAVVGLSIWGIAGRSMTAVVLLSLVALALGVLFVLPVGGADVPVVISLLNSFTGLAVAATGAVLRMTLLIVAGTLVGASGTLLTQLMAKAMGRPLTSILFGAITAKPTTGEVEGADTDRSVRTGTVEDVAVQLAYARRVVVVPGYGLAVAQAQHTVRELAELLEQRGVEVVYGIHPVAGRMP